MLARTEVEGYWSRSVRERRRSVPMLVVHMLVVNSPIDRGIEHAARGTDSRT